jgi:hypothetical protein
MGIKIFTRTNKGVVTSNEGERFLGYARQVLEQASLLEGVYKSGTKIKQQFCVSTQHYSFAVNAFGDATREAGAAAPEQEGNWAKSTFDDLVQYNDGFKTNLIGTPQQIAERIVNLKNVGVDLILSGFLHFIEEVEYFGENVLPLVRQIEQQQLQHLQIPAKSA